MFHRPTIVFALSLVAAAAPLTAQDLAAGKPAPPLQVSKWVKGEPVKELAKDHVYVVEFWATWCGPCIAGMPHLTEVQKKHGAALTVVGVTAADEHNPLDEIEAMVKAKGDTIGYTIAVDDGSKTTASWFEAAGQEGIPTCFVVDKAGTIAWIGHPMWLDVILPDVLAGKYEVEALKGKPDAIEKRLQRVFFAAAMKPEVALKEAEQLTTEFPFLSEQVDQGMFGMMLEDHAKLAWPIGERMIKRATAAKNANTLNYVAWSIVDPEAKVGERNLDLAMTAATKAVEITSSKEPNVLDTLARVHAWKGDFAKALELQKKAVALLGDDADAKAQLTPALNEYEAKVKAAGSTAK